MPDFSGWGIYKAGYATSDLVSIAGAANFFTVQSGDTLTISELGLLTNGSACNGTTAVRIERVGTGDILATASFVSPGCAYFIGGGTFFKQGITPVVLSEGYYKVYAVSNAYQYSSSTPGVSAFSLDNFGGRLLWDGIPSSVSASFYGTLSTPEVSMSAGTASIFCGSSSWVALDAGSGEPVRRIKNTGTVPVLVSAKDTAPTDFTTVGVTLKPGQVLDYANLAGVAEDLPFYAGLLWVRSTGGVGEVSFDYVSGSSPSGEILDTLSVMPQFAFSLRLLTQDYTGPLIRLRRTSDNVEQDFFPVSGQLDSSAILAWCGGSSARVRTWYNQVGATNAVQVNSAIQPHLVLAGVYIGMVSSLNAGDRLSIDVTSFSGFTNASIFTVGARTSSAPGMHALQVAGSDNHHPFGDSRVYTSAFISTRVSTSAVFSLPAIDEVQSITEIVDSANLSISVYQNGLLKSTISIPAFAVLTSANIPFSSNNGRQKMGELIVFNNVLTSDVSTLNNNINSFYGIP